MNNKSSHLTEFTLSGSELEFEFKQIESYKISADSVSLRNKIVMFEDNTKYKDDFYNSKIFLLIESHSKSSIKTIVCSYNKDDCVIASPKTFNVNSILQEAILCKNVKSLKVISNPIQNNNNYLVVATHKEIYLHSIDDFKDCKSILNIQKLGTISDMFVEYITEGNETKARLQVIINENIILEIDPFSVENSQNFIDLNNYFQSGKLDPIKYSIRKFTATSIFCSFLPYSVILNIDKSKYFKSLIIFENPVNPHNFAIRKGNEESQHQFTVSFSGGLAGVFHYESKTLVCIYKTSFGGIKCIRYSSDGKILAIGCEDDHAYIIDAEKNLLIYALAGHSNYVTGLCFDANIEEEAESCPSKTFSKLKSVDERKISIEKVDIKDYLIELNGLSNNDLSKLASKDFQLINDKMFSDTRKSKILSNKNLMNFMNECPNKPKTINSYLLYSAGLDGCLATWQIDVILEKNYINKSNYVQPESLKESNKLDTKLKTVLLDVSSENVIKSLEMVKVSPAQIYSLKVHKNFLVYLAKMNNRYSDVYLRMFYTKSNKSVLRSKDNDESKSTEPSLNLTKSQQSSGIKIKKSKQEI